MKTTLVLGLGNTIMSDDGVGPMLIKQLQNDTTIPADVSLLDGGTLGLDLLPDLEGVRLLIIVDAVKLGQPAGTLMRLVDDEIPLALETKLSPHQVGMKDLLAVARLMGHLPDKIVLIGIQPLQLELGTELTPPVKAAIPALLAMVRAEISSL